MHTAATQTAEVAILSFRQVAHDRPLLASALLWFLAVVLTVLTFTWQDKTGPTQPLTGDVPTAAGTVHFVFVRSGTVGVPLPVALVDPVPAGVSGSVEYRRFRSNDPWTRVPMKRGTFPFERRGNHGTLSGIGVALPGLAERAGKYEILVHVDDGSGKPFSITGDKPVYARFKAEVPTRVLIAHVFVIFASMAFALRTVLAAIFDTPYHRLIIATICSLLLGAFVLGPIVQWYAFGVWWAGVPFGYDWTDNKVLVSLAAWIVTAWANRGGRRNRLSVYAAGVVTLLVYFIPHSVFGSEYDYTTGTGHGTAG